MSSKEKEGEKAHKIYSQIGFVLSKGMAVSKWDVVRGCILFSDYFC